MSNVTQNILSLMVLICSHHLGFTQPDFTPTLIANEIPNIVALFATDINENEDNDIFVRTYLERPTAGVNSKQFKLFWLANLGGSFSEGGTLFHINGGSGGLDFTIFHQQFTDIDANGFVDVLTSDFTKILGVNSNGFQWHKNHGNGTFEANTIEKKSFGQSFGHPIISNIDGDSTADILIYRLEKVLRYQYTGSGFDDFDLVDTLMNQTFGKLYSEDINSDGKDDLLDYSNGILSWFQNDGQGNFNATQHIISNNLIADSLIFLDFHQNGKIDVISVQNNTGIFCLKNIGNGNFEAPLLIFPLSDMNNTFKQLNLGDIDQDGAIDLILNDTHNGISWIKNNGDGVFEAIKPITTTPSKFIQTVDFDKDGYLDVLSATDHNEIYLYRNNLSETDSTLNILESSFGIKVKLFPNPMSLQTTIQLSRLPPFAFDIVVIDQKGSTVQRMPEVNQNSIVITKGGLSPGLYHIHFRQRENGRLLGNYPLIIQ